MIKPYSYLKAAYHLEDIQALRDRKPNPPRHILINISDLCNQNCSFCSYRMDTGFSLENFGEKTTSGRVKRNPNRMIPFEKMAEILHDCAKIGIKAVQFTGGGEPTLHPEYLKIFQLAQNLNLETSLVSNGTMLQDWDFPTIQRMKWVRISLDAGTPETYAEVRESKLWHRALNTLARLGRIENGPLVGVSFVVTKRNWKEILTAAKLVKGFNIPYMRVTALLSSEGSSYYNGIYDEVSSSIKRAIGAVNTTNFKLIDLFSERIEDLDKGSPLYSFCGHERFVLYLGGNQKLYRCCTTAYTNHGEIGDLKNKSLKSWWNNDAQEQYKDFDAQTCIRCQFNEQNEIIDTLVNNPPMHSNFV